MSLGGSMRTRSLVAALLGLSWMLGACGDDSPTQPTSPSDRVPTEPQLAVAPNTWITRANMWGAERWDLAATSLSNAAGQSILYAIGGRSAAGGPLGKVMAYNVVTNTWTEKASLPMPLWGTSGATVLNGKIYVAGGCAAVDCSFSGPSSGLLVYDPARNTWTGKRPIPFGNSDDGFPAGGGVSGVIAGRLYVVSQCWYVPQSDFWFDNCVPSFFSL